MCRSRRPWSIIVLGLLLASTLSMVGCSSKAGDGEPLKGEHPALQHDPEERALAVLAALWSGQMQAEESEQTALLLRMLDLAVPSAMADPAYDSCEQVENPDFGTISMQGTSGVFGSQVESVMLSAGGSYCWNASGDGNDNTANQLFKSFTMNGVVATCSWGETYNFGGSGVYQAVSEGLKDLYGSFDVTGPSVNTEFDCTMSLSNAEDPNEAPLGDTVNAGSCTDGSGNVWGTWSQIDVGESCVLTIGNTPVYDPPNAVCGDDLAQYTLTNAYFDGTGSSHPNGAPLTYSWALTPPTGSGSTLVNDSGPSPYAFTDLAGDYVATLTVAGPDGQTDSCSQTITAIPYENFRAELYWLTHTDDLDLHLLRPNPPNALRSQGDCFYANMNPNWADPASSADDPSLDVDDIWGMGPENINIDDPSTDPSWLGWYQVVVHDYPWTIWDDSPNEAIINIYLDGVLERTYNITVSGDNQYYYVAKIHWPSGLIVDCNGLGGCP